MVWTFDLRHFRFIIEHLDKSNSKVTDTKRPQCHGSDGKKVEPKRTKGKRQIVIGLKEEKVKGNTKS